jgi:glycine/D-amino acid oxidase-like deaminating enzyme
MAAGYGGDGLVLSAVTAEIMSTIINDTAAPDTLATFSYNRFTTH